jgi:hypothetical protein
MWGEEEEDFKEGLSGLPLERIIGEEAFLGIGDLKVGEEFRGSMGDSGESNDEVDGNGTESWAGGRERKREGGLFCERWVGSSLASSCWSCSSLKWNMGLF